MHLDMETLIPTLTWGRLGVVALVVAPVAIITERIRMKVWLKKELAKELYAGRLGRRYEAIFADIQEEKKRARNNRR